MKERQNPFPLVNRLVEENFRLAQFFAGKYQMFYGYNDALSIALEGLLAAAQRFDDQHGPPFGAYASNRIRWRFNRYKQHRDAQRRGGGVGHSSLDELRFNDGNSTLADALADEHAVDPGENLGEQESHRDVRAMLDKLSPRNRRILELRFGLNGEPPMILDEIAKIYDLTRERVRQIEAESLRKFWRAKHRKPLEGVRLTA